MVGVDLRRLNQTMQRVVVVGVVLEEVHRIQNQQNNRASPNQARIQAETLAKLKHSSIIQISPHPKFHPVKINRLQTQQINQHNKKTYPIYIVLCKNYHMIRKSSRALNLIKLVRSKEWQKKSLC